VVGVFGISLGRSVPNIAVWGNSKAGRVVGCGVRQKLEDGLIRFMTFLEGNSRLPNKVSGATSVLRTSPFLCFVLMWNDKAPLVV